MVDLLLAETLTPDTGISFALLATVGGLVGGAVLAGFASRILNHFTIKHLREDVKENEACLQEHTQQLQALNTDKAIREKIGEDHEKIAEAIGDGYQRLADVISIQGAAGGDPARSGTRPYPRGRG